MTDSCHRCAECKGQEHHFLPIAEWDEEAGEFFYPCKHCDVKAPTCAECEEAIWPPDSGLCAYCSELDDDDIDPAEFAAGDEPMPEDE